MRAQSTTAPAPAHRPKRMTSSCRVHRQVRIPGGRVRPPLPGGARSASLVVAPAPPSAAGGRRHLSMLVASAITILRRASDLAAAASSRVALGLLDAALG